MPGVWVVRPRRHWPGSVCRRGGAHGVLALREWPLWLRCALLVVGVWQLDPGRAWDRLQEHRCRLPGSAETLVVCHQPSASGRVVQECPAPVPPRVLTEGAAARAVPMEPSALAELLQGAESLVWHR